MTVRDPDRWYASVRDTLYSLKTATDDYLAGRAARGFEASRKHFVFYENRIWEDLFGGRFDDRDHAVTVFQRHVADVQRHVPALWIGASDTPIPAQGHESLHHRPATLNREEPLGLSFKRVLGVYSQDSSSSVFSTSTCMMSAPRSSS